MGQPYQGLVKEEFIDQGCTKEEDINSNNYYEKADFVSRMVKKTNWNKEYNLGDWVNEQVRNIHPVWNTDSDLECERFKRETSKLWEVVSSMSPFHCTSICQAPDDVFLGAPQIMEFLDKPEAT